MNRRNFLVSSAGALGLLAPTARSAGEKTATTMLERDPKGWLDISPGPNLEGWTEYSWFDQRGDPNAWRHANQWHMDRKSGILLCDGHQEAHTMFLHDRELTDFIYHVEWRFSPAKDKPAGYAGYNSGVLVRMLPERSTRKVMHQIETGSVPLHAGWLRGGSMENGALTIMDTKVMVDGKWQRVDPGFPKGWIPHVKSIDPASDPKGLRNAYEVGIQASVHPPSEWNAYEIVCRKSAIQVWTNGVESCRADNLKILEGLVGLEAEWHRIEFRNLRVKELV